MMDVRIKRWRSANARRAVVAKAGLRRAAALWSSGGAAIVVALAGCVAHDEPGPIAGIWRLDQGGVMVQFRKGESDVGGVVGKVSYEIKGRDVAVTNEDGPAKGRVVHYTVVGLDTVSSSASGVMRKIP